MDFAPLESVSKPLLTISEVAHYLNRRPQTVRVWTSRDTAPIPVIRINGKPAFRTIDVRNLINGDTNNA